MILQKADLTQKIHRDSMLEKIQSEKENVDLLLNWGLLDEQPLGWRAAWLLRLVLKKNDPRLKDRLSEILSRFSSFSESQKREWLKTMEHQTIEEDQEGILFDLAITEWRNIHNHPALRASAANMIFITLKKYPELKEELAHLMTTEYVGLLSPGIQKGVLREWQKFS